MILHKKFDINFGGKTGLFYPSFTNLEIKRRRPFQFININFHLIENQHFKFNVGFFLPEISKIK